MSTPVTAFAPAASRRVRGSAGRPPPTLRNRMIVALLLLTLAPMVVVLTLLYTQLRGEAKTSAAHELEGRAILSAQHIDELVTTFADALRVSSLNPIYSQASPAVVAEMFRQTLQYQPMIDRLELVDRDGVVLVSTLTGNQGRAFAPADERLRALAREALAKPPDALFVGGSGDAEIHALSGVGHAGGNSFAVLVATLSTDYLRRRVAELDDGHHERTIAAIVDRSGHVVLSADPRPDHDFLRHLIVPLAASAARHGRLDSTTVATPGRESEQLVTGYARVGPFGDNQFADWILVASTPTQRLLAPMHRLFAPVALGIAVVTLIAVLAGQWLARSIARPLEQLADAAARFGVGDAAAQAAPCHASHEIDGLARDFNTMATRVAERSSALETANAKLNMASLVIDQSPAVLFRWGIAPGWPVLYVSPNVRQWGYSPEALVGGGLPYLDLVHPDDAAHIGEEVARFAASGAIQTCQECRIRTGSGEVIWVDHRATIVRDGSGAPLYFQGVATDVTARKRDEDALRELTRELQAAAELNAISGAVIQSSAEGVMVTDAHLQIQSVNPAFEAITGFAPADAIGRSPRILFSGRHDDTFFHTLHDQVDAQGRWRGEIWNKRRNGEIYPQQTSVSILRDPAGRITHYASVFSDNTAQNLLETQLREMAAHDGLTGIANRRQFDEVLAREWARALRDGRPLSLLMADIDFFKKYNDAYGHIEGDRCLRLVARAVKQAANRSTDVAARYGGEEFAVILPDTDAAAAATMGERIRVSVAALALAHRESDVAPTVTISVGAATLQPQAALLHAELIGAADRALYRAKQSGRNRVVAAPAETLVSAEAPAARRRSA